MDNENVGVGEGKEADSAVEVYSGYARCPYCKSPIFSEQFQGINGVYECSSCHNPIRPEFLEWR